MARVFVTGSADGLGRAAAQTLLDDGHEVVVHARSTERLAAVDDLVAAAPESSSATSPTSSRRGRRRPGERLGRIDAVIHNAGV